MEKELIKSLRPKNIIHLSMIVWSVVLLVSNNIMIYLFSTSIEVTLNLMMFIIPLDSLCIYVSIFMYHRLYEKETDDEYKEDLRYVEYVYTIDTAIIIMFLPIKYSVEIFTLVAIISLLLSYYYYRKLLDLRVGALFMSETRDEDYSPLWGVSKVGMYLSITLILFSIILSFLQNTIKQYVPLEILILPMYILLIITFLRITTLRIAYKRLLMIDGVMYTVLKSFNRKKISES